MPRDKHIKVGDLGVEYIESGDTTMFIVTWVLGLPDEVSQPDGGQIFFRTGLVAARDIDALNMQLDKMAKTYHDFTVLDVRYMEFVQLLENMHDEWRAYQVMTQFDQNVDKDSGGK